MASSDPISVESLLQHDRWLRDLARRLAHDESEADEFVQETWLAAMRRPPRVDGGDPRGWLRRVMSNIQRQSRRGAGRRARRELESGADAALGTSPAVDEIEGAIELRQLLLEEVRRLEEPLRTAVVMRHLEGRTLNQIAAELDVPKDTLKSRLSRGLEQLRTRLDRRTGDRASWVAMCVAISPRPEGLPLSTPLLMSTASKTAVLAIGIAGLATVGLLLWNPNAAQLIAPLGQDDASASLVPESGESSDSSDVGSDGTRASAGQKDASIPAAEDAVSFHGRVVGLHGEPVAGAVVHAVGQNEPRLTTDFAGAFTWVLDATPATLVAEAPGLVPVLTGHAIPGRTQDLVLVVAPSATYAGHIVDEEGIAVPGASLRLRLDDTWTRELTLDLAGGSPQSWHAQADEYGAFRFEGVPAISDALLWVDQGGRTSLFQAPGETREDLLLVLHDKLSEDERWALYPHLTGFAVLHDGTPARGAELVVADFQNTTTDAGAFRIPYSQLGPDTVLRAYMRGLLPVEARAGDGEENHGWPSSLVVRFGPESVGTIRGVLTDASGAPAADMPIWLTDPTPIDESLHPDFAEGVVGANAVETGEDGSFELTAFPGRTYTIRAFDVSTWTHAQSGWLQAGDHGVQLSFPAPPGSGTITGRCVDRDGAPIPDVEVRPVWHATSGASSVEHSFKSARSDAEGVFVLEDHPLGFESIACEGTQVIPHEVQVTTDMGEPLTLTLPRRASLQVRTTITEGDPNYFMLENGQGDSVPLYRFQWLGNGRIEGADVTNWGTMDSGSSGTYTAAEGPHTVRVFAAETEVGRADVVLVAGETTEVVID